MNLQDLFDLTSNLNICTNLENIQVVDGNGDTLVSSELVCNELVLTFIKGEPNLEESNSFSSIDANKIGVSVSKNLDFIIDDKTLYNINGYLKNCIEDLHQGICKDSSLINVMICYNLVIKKINDYLSDKYYDSDYAVLVEDLLTYFINRLKNLGTLKLSDEYNRLLSEFGPPSPIYDLPVGTIFSVVNGNWTGSIKSIGGKKKLYNDAGYHEIEEGSLLVLEVF